MKTIDLHNHLFDLDEDSMAYTDRLADECERAGVVKVCLMGLPDHYGFSLNKDVEAAVEKYPDLMIGFAGIDMAQDGPDTITGYHARGFKGLKLITPPANYDDKRFYGIYERAAELGMPMLFHLGIIGRDDRLTDCDINSDRMRPVYLDTIARSIPSATIVGAHLGNPWYEESTMSCRWNPNLYFDLSGSTLKKKTPEDLAKILWWRRDSRYVGPDGKDAWEKIVFGSDVPCHEISDVINDYKTVMDALEISADIQQQVFYSNAIRILGIEHEPG